PETDTDGDGVPDCKDQCPNDPKNTQRGQCGCAGDPDVTPAGTPCTDGVCAGLQVCGGAGQSGDPSACQPEAGCGAHPVDNHTYWLCPTRPWVEARTQCDTIPGNLLAKIDGPSENPFIASIIARPSWMGASDATVEGTWRWQNQLAADGAQ